MVFVVQEEFTTNWERDYKSTILKPAPFPILLHDSELIDIAYWNKKTNRLVSHGRTLLPSDLATFPPQHKQMVGWKEIWNGAHHLRHEIKTWPVA